MDTARLRKAATAVYLATDSESVAKDISDMLNGAADEIEILISTLKEIRDISKSWEGRKEVPFWNLGDKAEAALNHSIKG